MQLLQALVIATGRPGAGPVMRHSRCFVPQFGLSGLRQPNHLVLLEVLAKALGRDVDEGTSQVRDVAGQVLAKAGLQKNWYLFLWYMVTHLADRGTRRLTWLLG